MKRKLSQAAMRARMGVPSRAQEIALERLIRKRLDLFSADMMEVLLPILPRVALREDAQHTFVQRRLEGLELRIAIRFDRTKLGEDIGVIAKRVGNQHMKEFRRVVGVSLRDPRLGVADEIDGFRQDNIDRITSIAGKQLTEVQSILEDAETPGLRWETVRDQIVERIGVGKSRAALIARDQVISLRGQIAKKRQQNVGIDEYVWVTSGDTRVRDTHEANGSNKFSWATPPPTGHPGEEILCRCTAFPVLTELE